jgi:hypothetical protein
MTNTRATIVGAGLVPAPFVPALFVPALYEPDQHQGDHKGAPLHYDRIKGAKTQF